MKPWLEPVAVASALCAGAGSVCAQTVITHEIVREPVAAVIVREPVQAIITAAPVQAFVTEPVQTFVAEPALAAQRWQITRPVETMGVGSAEAIVVPPTTRAASKSRAAAKPRIVAKRRIAVRNRQAMPASVRLPAVAPLVVREAVSLTPGERSVLYRTIVGEQVVPEPIVVREQMVPAAPAVAAPLVTEGVATTPAPVPAAPIVRDQVVSAPMIVGDQPARLVAQGVITAAAPAAVAYTVGSRLPANIPLYAIPESAALQVPVVRRYSYAFVNDRVLLVEPISGIVVAELDR